MDEQLIRSNVELCLKNEELKKTIDHLEHELKAATYYNDMICGLARKMSNAAKVVHIGTASYGQS